MNLIAELILAAVRHLLTAYGFSKAWDDPEMNGKITGAVVFLVGYAWSAFRKFKANRQKADQAITPIPPVPPKPTV